MSESGGLPSAYRVIRKISVDALAETDLLLSLGRCNIERQGKALVGGPRANGDQVQEISRADTWTRCASARAGGICFGGTGILPMEFNDLIGWCFEIRMTSPNEDRKV